MHEDADAWRRIRKTVDEVPLLEESRERSLLRAALAGDRAAVSELVRSHMRLVVKIAARYRRGNLACEDLVSEGVLGLMEALRRFDLAQDARFAAYASWWIRARIGQYALANRRLVRIPSTRNARSVARGLRRTERLLAQRFGRAPSSQELADALCVRAADVAEVQTALGCPDVSLTPGKDELGIQLASEYESPEAVLERRQQETLRRRGVHHALAALSAREQRVVNEHYLEDEGRTLSQLGLDYGISRQRVGQVLTSARGKLREALEQVA